METKFEETQVEIPEDERHPWFSFKKLMAFGGPGWLMSIAYLDPGNLAGDMTAGTNGKYGLLWVLFWATTCGWLLQCMAARLGVVTGKDLSQVCRDQFHRPTRYTIWAMTEIAIIGADIQEIVGSAIAFNILFGIPLWAGALITVFDTFTFLFIHFFGVKKLEGFFAFLITIMITCFWINLFKTDAPSDQILKGTVVPQIPPGAFSALIGLVGAIIMPHNIYLHSSLVQSRKVDKANPAKVKEANKYFSIEAAISLFVSFLINLAVISTFAVFDDPNLDLETAPEALRTSFGNDAVYIWGVGLLAAGQSATMTGTYAGQYVMQGFLDLHIPIWQRTLLTRLAALGPAMMVVGIYGEPNINSQLNILQSIQLPFALLPLLKFSFSEKVMGDFKTGPVMKALSVIISLAVVAMNFYQTLDLVEAGLALKIIVGICAVIYIGFLVMVLRAPLQVDYQSSFENCKGKETLLSTSSSAQGPEPELCT